MRHAVIAALLWPSLAICQSVYSLEVLPAEHFQPAEKYTAITGLRIDINGNIAGVASKSIAGDKTKSTGFLWRASADPVRALVWGEGSAASDCEPRGFDAHENVIAYCGTQAPNVIFPPKGVSHRNGAISFEPRGTGGSWSAGAYHANTEIRGARASMGGPTETLLPAMAQRDSSALAINAKGDATGISGMLAGGTDGNGKSVVSGLAALWPQGKQEPQLIAAPPNSSWTAQVGRAIHDVGLIAGSTSPFPTTIAGCVGSASAPRITRAFVASSAPDSPKAELLPLAPGDPAATVTTPTSINSLPQIAGYRETYECVEGTLLRERRAIRWRKSEESKEGRWVAELLDHLPVTLTAICFRELELTEANEINENGQITGSGTCVDQSDERITFAYRLTPIGPEELPLR